MNGNLLFRKTNRQFKWSLLFKPILNSIPRTNSDHPSYSLPFWHLRLFDVIVLRMTRENHTVATSWEKLDENNSGDQTTL